MSLKQVKLQGFPKVKVILKPPQTLICKENLPYLIIFAL